MKTLFIADESSEIPDEVYEAVSQWSRAIFYIPPPTAPPNLFFPWHDPTEPWRRLVALIRGPGQRIQEKLKWPE